MAKFKKHKYWKHKTQLDTFLFIDSVGSDTGKRASVNACWMVQGAVEWWFVSYVSTIFIDKQDYANWERYDPKGTLRLT